MLHIMYAPASSDRFNKLGGFAGVIPLATIGLGALDQTTVMLSLNLLERTLTAGLRVADVLVAHNQDASKLSGGAVRLVGANSSQVLQAFNTTLSHMLTEGFPGDGLLDACFTSWTMLTAHV